MKRCHYAVYTHVCMQPQNKLLIENLFSQHRCSLGGRHRANTSFLQVVPGWIVCQSPLAVGGPFRRVFVQPGFYHTGKLVRSLSETETAAQKRVQKVLHSVLLGDCLPPTVGELPLLRCHGYPQTRRGCAAAERGDKRGVQGSERGRSHPRDAGDVAVPS